MRTRLRFIIVFFVAMLAAAAVYARDSAGNGSSSPLPPALPGAPEERLSINGYFNVEGDYQPQEWLPFESNGVERTRVAGLIE